MLMAAASVQAQAVYSTGAEAASQFFNAPGCVAAQQQSPLHYSSTPTSSAAASSGGCSSGTSAVSGSTASIGGQVSSRITTSTASLASCSTCFSNAFSEGFTAAGMLDFLHVTSSVLPTNTPVWLNFSAFLRVDADTANLFRNYSFGDNLTASLAGPTLYFHFVSGVALQSQSQLYQTYVGAIVPISLFLQTQVENEGDWSATTYIDLLSAGGANVDALDEDVTLTSDSGHDYATSTVTPEPATLVLMLTGLFGVGGVARARRRTRG